MNHESQVKRKGMQKIHVVESGYYMYLSCHSFFYPFATEAQVDTLCTTLCSLDINCISVIYDGNDLKCHMFTVSQDSVIAISDDETGFSYAEKIDCTWTSLNHDVRVFSFLKT